MKKALQQILSILTQKEKRSFIKLAMLDIIVSILDIGFLVLLLFIIDFYSRTQHSSSPRFEIFEQQPLLPVIIFFILFSIKNYFAFVVSRMQISFIYKTASRISGSRLLDYLDGNYADYLQTDSAVYMRNIGQQPSEFCNYVLKAVQQMISQVILILLTIIPIIIYNARLFPLLLLILIPPVALTGFIMKRKMNTVRLSIKKTSEHTGQHLKEALSSFVESNIYNKKHFFWHRYNFFREKESQYQAEHQVIQNLPSRLIEVFAVFGLFALVTINVYNKNSTGLNIITIGAFMAAAYKIIPGIVKILNSIGQAKTYWFTVTGLANANKIAVTHVEHQPVIRSIKFENVHFNYGKEPVLQNLSLYIHKGELTGITGASGKGKSTMINLLLGFLSPLNGAVIINDMPTSADDRKKYWGSISYVKQQSFLIHDSILKNIILEEEEYDRERFDMVLKITGVCELISNHAEGIHTVVSEEGKNFSGGQRQRIVLARSLYKNFDTLILDEPFSEMDNDSEKKLATYLRQLADEGKTVILITHSNESLSFCNRQILME